MYFEPDFFIYYEFVNFCFYNSALLLIERPDLVANDNIQRGHI